MLRPVISFFGGTWSRVLMAALAVLLAGRVSAADWPMWGYDARRSGASPAALALPQKLHLHWMRELPAPRRAWRAQRDDRDKLAFDLSYSPIVSDGRVFVPSMTTDSLTAYALDSGEELWRFYADGPVRLAAAAWNGKVYFVSDDARLYCLDAASGKQHWAYDAAPATRRVLGNERVVSMWAARGGPVVLEGTVYFAAGVWPFLGTFVFALDAETGAVRWANTGHGTDWQSQPHGGAYAFAGLAPQGYLAAAGDRLVVSGGRASPGLFDRRDGTLIHCRVEGKDIGGYRVRIEGERYINHWRSYLLSDGSNAPVGRPVDDKEAPGGASGIDDGKARKALRERTEAVREHLDGPVFESLVADGRLLVSTVSGRLYCFGAERSDEPRKFSHAPKTPTPADTPAGRQAAAILKQTGVSDGYALVLGAGDGELLEQLAVRSKLHLVVLEPEGERVDAVRRRLDRAGLYGSRVAVLPGAFGSTHYPPYISSLIVVTKSAADAVVAEKKTLTQLVELLRPYGGRAWFEVAADAPGRAVLTGLRPEAAPRTPRLFIRGARVVPGADHVLLVREGPLPGSGQWTHQYANSAQTVLSPDERVRPPFGPIWYGGPTNEHVLPRHAAGPRPQVAGGRLVILGVETISARCVFTGRELWVRKIPGIGHPFTNLKLEERWRDGRSVYMTNQPGAAYIGSPYVTLPDAIYVRFRHRVIRLNPATGEGVGDWPLPGNPPKAEEPDWGHISVSGDYVITTTYPHIFRGGQLGKAGDDSWDGISSEQLVVLNRHTGKVAWTRKAKTGFRHNAIVSSGGRLFVSDLLSEMALQMARFGDEDASKGSRLYALDLRTGREIWSAEKDVFGTFLSYSSKHDILVESGSRESRRPLADEPTALLARRGRDGKILWKRNARYDGPIILRGDTIVPGRPGAAIALLTGKHMPSRHPITGKTTPWSYWRSYGCSTATANTHLMFFRSGAAGFTALDNASGTGSLGGFKSGCTANLIPADGLLNAPDYTRTCTCSYQNQTSLGLIHMPELELWVASETLAELDTDGIRRLGINLGAPGNRLAEEGTLWIHVPTVAPSKPELSLQIKDGAGRLPRMFRQHALTMVAEQGLNWVAASGAIGLREMVLGGVRGGEAKFTVTLHFGEPENLPVGKRRFDIRINGRQVASGFDIVQAAGGPGRAVIKRFENIKLGAELRIVLTPSRGSEHPPILSGVEILRKE